MVNAVLSVDRREVGADSHCIPELSDSVFNEVVGKGERLQINVEEPP